MEIRKILEDRDLDRVMEIWLESNIEAHDFIDRSYWDDNYNNVRGRIEEADIYLIGQGKDIYGFMGLVDGYIAGVFITRQARGLGLGSSLVERAKKDYSKLSLHVYKKNQAALDFYLKRNFQVIDEKLDAINDELEYFMIWETSL